MNLPLWIFVGGILHFGILLASASVPLALDWKASLSKLDKLSRQLVWIHGGFIVLVIIGFGLLSVVLPESLAAGTPLARGICFFIAFFWLARLFVQFFVFDAKPALTTMLLKVGYHSLTLVFICVTAIYALAALQTPQVAKSIKPRPVVAVRSPQAGKTATTGRGFVDEAFYAVTPRAACCDCSAAR